jgi:hypothetical protein
MGKEFNEANFLAELAQFTGSQEWFRHGLNRNILFTEGAKYVADECGAYWLLDEIALNQAQAAVRAEEFQSWVLKAKNNRALLTCDDGNGNVVWKKRIGYTDFPLDEFKLYCTGGTIMVPSEY